MYKRVDADLAEDNVFGTVLPNVNPIDLCKEVSRYGSFASCCIVRKDLLDGILRQLDQHKIKVLSVSFGPKDFQYLLPYVNFDNDPVLKSNLFLVWLNDQHEVIDIEVIPAEKGTDGRRAEYSIGDQYVYSPALLAFASAMGLLAMGLEGPGNELLSEKREEYRCYKYFKTGSIALLAFLFLLLLSNFLVYN